MNQDDSSARMLSVESGADINPLSSDVPPLLGLVLRSLSSHKAHSSEGSLNLSSPLTESGFRNISPTVPELMKRYWSDPYLVAELVACICFGVLGHFAPDMIFQMSLHEREIPYQITANGDVILDQYINRPLVDHDTIPDWLLVVLAFILPLVVVIAVGTIGKTKHDVHSGVCALFFIVGSTEFITNFVKIYAGYFRPNFYEYCEFSADDMACASDRLDPRKSFPSGHASGSFCGMTMLTQYFFGKIGLHRRVVDELSDNTHVSLMQKRFFSILAGSPMFLAVFISSSRVHDDMHHPADIVGGALIGICCAIFGYGLWYSSIYSNSAGYPLSTVLELL